MWDSSLVETITIYDDKVNTTAKKVDKTSFLRTFFLSSCLLRTDKRVDRQREIVRLDSRRAGVNFMSVGIRGKFFFFFYQKRCNAFFVPPHLDNNQQFLPKKKNIYLVCCFDILNCCRGQQQKTPLFHHGKKKKRFLPIAFSVIFYRHATFPA